MPPRKTLDEPAEDGTVEIDTYADSGDSGSGEHWSLAPKTRRTSARRVDGDTLQDVARRGAKTTGWSEGDIEALQLLAASLLTLLTSRCAALCKEPALRASEAEINCVAEPLARIICRHLKIPKGKRGDLADILAICAAGVAYTIRVFDTLDRRKQEEVAQLTKMHNIGVPDPEELANRGWQEAA